MTIQFTSHSCWSSCCSCSAPSDCPRWARSLGAGLRGFKESISGEDASRAHDCRAAARAGRRRDHGGPSRCRATSTPLHETSPLDGAISRCRCRMHWRPARLRPLSHDDQLSVVGHLDELRTRLIVSLAGARGRVRHLLLAEPRAAAPRQQAARAPDPAAGARRARAARRDLHGAAQRPGRRRAARHASSACSAPQRQRARGPGSLARVQRSLERDVDAAVGAARGRPAGDARDRRAVHDDGHRHADLRADPLAAGPAAPGLRLPDAGARARAAPADAGRCMLAIPVLFVAGVVFGYFVVLPAAVRFFQNFNSDAVQRARAGEPVLQVRRHDAAGDGAAVPGPGRDPRGHSGRHRHATTAAAQPPLRGAGLRRSSPRCCPGDAITMLLETVPLYLLFEVGVLLAAVSDRRSAPYCCRTRQNSDTDLIRRDGRCEPTVRAHR